MRKGKPVVLMDEEGIVFQVERTGDSRVGEAAEHAVYMRPGVDKAALLAWLLQLMRHQVDLDPHLRASCMSLYNTVLFYVDAELGGKRVSDQPPIAELLSEDDDFPF